MGSVLAPLDPLLAEPSHLGDRDFDDLVAFVRYGLLDDRGSPASLCRLIPNSVPGDRPMLFFEDCHVSAPLMTEHN